jgi:hypothetical protein
MMAMLFFISEEKGRVLPCLQQHFRQVEVERLKATLPLPLFLAELKPAIWQDLDESNEFEWTMVPNSSNQFPQKSSIFNESHRKEETRRYVMYALYHHFLLFTIKLKN